MASHGDEPECLETFEVCALPHANDLFRTAVSMLGSRAEAEDAMQEAYLQAWKSFGRFTPGTNCRAWLFKILFHTVSHHRRKWLGRWVSQDLQSMEDRLADKPMVPEHLTDEGVLSAFRKIPPKYAEAVMLADVHEFTYKEIQDTLGIPIGTVMSRLNRGREALRTHLGKPPSPGPVIDDAARGARI
jgi:RNA polymerase sigma-70 factor, ECF subfamily